MFNSTIWPDFIIFFNTFFSIFPRNKDWYISRIIGPLIFKCVNIIVDLIRRQYEYVSMLFKKPELSLGIVNYYFGFMMFEIIDNSKTLNPNDGKWFKSSWELKKFYQWTVHGKNKDNDVSPHVMAKIGERKLKYWH